VSTTQYLRFPDAATFEATLPEGFERRGETGHPLPEGVEAISIIGAISRGGQWDEAGNVVVAPEILPGFHVNALGALPEAWAPYVVTPGAPVRVFGSRT
jgi:hypothetical protein